MNNPSEPTDRSNPCSTGDPAPSPKNSLTRRKFLRSSGGVAAGSALYLSTGKSAFSQGKSDDLNVALVGCGAEGTALRDSIYKDADDIGFRFVAVCDIWEYNRGRMARALGKYKHPVEEFVDIDEMLAKKPEIDAVIIATPDFMHAPHTIAALNTANVKGVYCEKMMSNSIDSARDMVRAQIDTGKLLQIGHQRRSNPRYLHVHDNLIHGNKILGRVDHAYGQWNRGVSKPLGFPKKFPVDPAILEQYGYANMLEFRNWRWFKRYGGGPISDLGAHQIDIYNWMFGVLPRAVVVSGGRDYYKEFEFEDNAMAIYEYDVPDQGVSRAYYQVLTTNGSQGFYEKFMGENGTIAISEVPSVNQAFRESHADSWDEYGKQGLLIKNPINDVVHNKIWEQPKPWTRPEQWMDDGDVMDARVAASAALDQWELPVVLEKRPHNPHLRNFLLTVKNNGKQDDLNCPALEGFQTCVTVLKINEALHNGGRYDFKPEDFTV